MEASIREAIVAKVEAWRLANGVTGHRRAALEAATVTLFDGLAGLLSVLPGQLQRTATLSNFAGRVLRARINRLRESALPLPLVTADLFDVLRADAEFVAMLVTASRELGVER